MNVSLSRKIHIIALPQGTPNTCLSLAKSLTTPWVPVASITASDIDNPNQVDDATSTKSNQI